MVASVYHKPFPLTDHVDDFWKHCGRKRNCSKWAISIYHNVFNSISLTLSHVHLHIKWKFDYWKALKTVWLERINNELRAFRLWKCDFCALYTDISLMFYWLFVMTGHTSCWTLLSRVTALWHWTFDRIIHCTIYNSSASRTFLYCRRVSSFLLELCLDLCRINTTLKTWSYWNNKSLSV